MVISANIPMRDFLGWIRSLGASAVIEFVGPEDEMTRRLLKNKANEYSDYTQENFEAILREMFTMVESQELKGGVRTIYFVRPK